MVPRPARGYVELFRMDVARWLIPESVADPTSISLQRTLVLLYRHLPLRAMAWFRLGGWVQSLRVPALPSLIQHRLLFKYGLELAIGADVGGGLYIAHPVGCVLHAEHIGDNVTVVSNVTFGTREDGRWPSIHAGSFFGAGARVLGGITIGEAARIGANAVVIHDVPAGAVAVGVPARVKSAGNGERS